MPTAKLSDAKPVPQSGTAKLSDATAVNDPNIDLKRKWHSMTPKDRQSYILSLSPEELDKHLTALGTFNAGELELKKSPEWKGFELKNISPNPIGTQIGIPVPTQESRQWMKEKALGLLNRGQEQLSNIAGPFGAHAGRVGGAAIGEAIAPEGGAAIGGPAGEIIGAGLAGGGAEAVRQGLEHVEGVDKYNEPWENTSSERLRRILHAGQDQMIAQTIGMGTGELLRPTLKRSINNLYEAGMLDYGDPLGKGNLESVINDVVKTEKVGKPVVTVRDFYDNLKDLSKDIGTQIDEKMNLPIRQGGKVVPLKDATPNPTPLVDLIKSFETKDEGLVKRASLVGRDERVRAAKKYQQMVKDRALTFQQKPWTYGELAKERIDINNELNEYYRLTPDGKRLFLSSHPLFEVDKSIADYIRKVTYPEMDRLSGQPLGATAEMQGKRGALINLQNQLLEQMEKLKTETRRGTTKGMNIGAYATPSGIGAAVHRLPLKMSVNDLEGQADTKVSRAFGHNFESWARKKTTTPFGSEVWGDNILSLPVRALIGYRDSGVLSTHPTPKPPTDSDNDNGPQSSVAPATNPKDLIDKAKRLNPTAQGQVAFSHIAVNPLTGHRIGHDGNVWRDVQTGVPVSA